MPVWTQIALTDAPRALLPSNHHYGPFEYGGSLFAILNRDPIAGPFTNRAYRSDDNGLTWAEIDGANRPTNVFHSAVFYAGGATIYYAYFDKTVQTLRIKNFNMASGGSWQAEIGGGPVAGTMLYLGRLSNGDCILLYGVFAGSRPDTYYVLYSGGWGVPVVVSSDTVNNQRSRPAGILVAANDTAHLFFTLGKNTLAFPTFLRHRALPNGGALGADQQITELRFGENAVGAPSIWNGKLAFPYGQQYSDVFPYPRRPAIAYGDPAGNTTPAWTTEIVDSTGIVRGGLIEDHYLFTLVNGSSLEYFWADDPDFLPAGTLNSLYRTTNSGSGWSASIVFFTDAKLNSSDYLHNLSVTLLSNGQFGVLLDRQPNAGVVGEHGSATGFILGGEPEPAAAAGRSRVFYRKPFFPPR